MAENSNHHYVPQYYFRQFTAGEAHICAFLKKNGKVITHAPIKGQCSRKMFYGSAEIEINISQLEGKHSESLRHLIATAETSDLTKWSDNHYFWLLQAVVFQHARTLLQVEKTSPANCKLVTHIFKEHLKTKFNDEQMVKMHCRIDSGRILITENPTKVLFNQIKSALDCASLLCDLHVRLLINNTDYPFIFGDSPVVYYNTYYHSVKNRGVLGLQCPGLQIFYPLTSNIQLMLYDKNVYTGPFLTSPCYDLFLRSDVSELNALQLHHSRDAVYFKDAQDSAYVSDLHMIHSKYIKKPKSVFKVNTGWLFDGKVADGDLLHMFEEQVNHRLLLSFVHCDPVDPKTYKFRYRSPEIASSHKELHGDSE